VPAPTTPPGPLTLDSATVLRTLRPSDAASFHALIQASRAHLDRWLRWSSAIRSVADAERFLLGFEDRSERGDGWHLGIWEGDALAGGVVCWYIHPEHRNAEVGYWLGAGFTGRGLATRAAGAGVGYLVQTARLRRIEMQCAVDNRRSRAVAERLGFRLEGVRRQSHWITDRFLDHAVYGLLAEEWGAPVGAGGRR
jgi:ribosomal-protein-serine acetyltransferase